MRRITKIFQSKATSIDDSAKTIRFKISDNQTDRMGERVDQTSWNFNNYLSNPIVLWGHDPSQPENVLGQTTELSVSPDGSATYATMRFDDDINPQASLVWKQLLRGTIRAVSVGFINHSEEMDNDTPVLKDNELLEISVVPIPANARAVALSLKEGTLSTKDAKWLMDSMRKEAAFIEEQMKQSEQVHKEKSMTDEQAQALIDGMAKLTEKVDALTTENAALKEQVEALKPAEETDEEKAAREAAEQEAAKKAEEEEAARKAEEEAAKSGKDDQGGAADEFDEDAELTPELQAEIDAAIEAELVEA